MVASSSRRLTDPGLKINWNPVTETWRNLKLASANIVVFRLLGISWMWFRRGNPEPAPSFAKDVMHGNEQVAPLLVVFPSASPPARCCVGAEQTACGTAWCRQPSDECVGALTCTCLARHAAVRRDGRRRVPYCRSTGG
jgi:hypothetical protein